MTLQELTNLYQLISHPHTAELAFKLAEGLGYTDVELIELLWEEFKEYKILDLNHIIIVNLGQKLAGAHKDKNGALYSPINSLDEIIQELKLLQ